MPMRNSIVSFMLSFRVVLFILLATLVSQAVRADVILQPAMIVSNTLGDSFSFPQSSIIDQVGLQTPYTSGVTDFSTYTSPWSGPGTSWVSNFGTTSGVITFDLGAIHNVSAMALWNSSQENFVVGGGGGGGPVDVKDFSLYSDSDANLLNGATTLGNFTATETNTPHPIQKFTFATTSGRYVHMEIHNAYNPSSVGFTEIAFAIPEPSSSLLVGFAVLMGSSWIRRRYRTSL